MSTSRSRQDGGHPAAATWNERVAAIYDNWVPDCEEAMIDALASLARGGRALELGIGTGRVALPLAGRGVEVHGVDISPAMIARLRAKPGGAAIPVTIGDIAEVPVEGEFDLIYAIYGTINHLLTQDDQVRCFVNAAHHLAAEGVLVIEAPLPPTVEPGRAQPARAGIVEPDRVSLEIMQYDPAQQVAQHNHVVLTASGVELFPSQYRYVWPSEMDLMARIAGLRLRYRVGDWEAAPFTGESTTQIAVYERARPPARRPRRTT